MFCARDNRVMRGDKKYFGNYEPFKEQEKLKEKSIPWLGLLFPVQKHYLPDFPHSNQVGISQEHFSFSSSLAEFAMMIYASESS